MSDEHISCDIEEEKETLKPDKVHISSEFQDLNDETRIEEKRIKSNELMKTFISMLGTNANKDQERIMEFL